MAIKIPRKDIEVLHKLGSGGYGTVYQVIWKKNSYSYRTVAAKVLHTPDWQEVEILSALDHPNIIKLFGVVEEQYNFMQILELCEGGDLGNYLKKHKYQPLPQDLFNAWSQQAARGVEYLHRIGIIHSDIKPNNYLINNKHILKLCDFGISKDTFLTLENCSFAGTIPYMAPEIFVEECLSPKSDVYSYGIVLWQLLTREVPFQGSLFQVILYQVGHNGQRPPIPADCPQFLADLLRWCWRKDYHKRPSMEEVLEVLTMHEKTMQHALGTSSHKKAATSGQGLHSQTQEEANQMLVAAKSPHMVDVQQQPASPHKVNVQQQPESPLKVNVQQQPQLLSSALPVKEIPFSNMVFHEHIGRGRFSEVYYVSLTKTCKGHAEAAAKKIFIKANEEIEMLSSLHHQHIATVLGVSYDHPLTYLVLELAPHGSLHDHLIRNKLQPISEELKRKWMKESALAIEYLHDNNVLHMDIKARNCLLFHDFTLKLCDFGLASKLTEQGITQTTMKGTWMFWAPEIIKPGEGVVSKYSKNSDIFAYGMLVLEICTREEPFPGANFFQYMMTIYEGRAKTPTIPESCPKDLSDLMKRCWNHEPTERPTIGTIIEELAYWELVTANQTGSESVNVNAAPIFQVKSMDINQDGGKIEVNDTGVSIKIPPGAIPDEEPVEITASVHWDKEYHHTIQGNDIIIGPAIHCKPDGLRFKKPVQITFPHSAENITAKQLAVWTRTSSASQDCVWRVIWQKDGNGSVEIDGSAEATLIVEANRIKLRVYHFSGFSFSYWWNWLWGNNELQQGPEPGLRQLPFLRLMFLTFMQPSNLMHSGVFIKIYVVREDEVQNVIDVEKDSKACQCATRRPYKLNLREENTSDMKFVVRILGQYDGWEPQKAVKKIEYSALQFGELDSMCFVYFEKKKSCVNEIMGTIEVYRERDTPIAEIPFLDPQSDIQNTSNNMSLLSLEDVRKPSSASSDTSSITHTTTGAHPDILRCEINEKVQYDIKCSGLEAATKAVLAAHNGNQDGNVNLVNCTLPGVNIEEDFDKKLLDQNLVTKYGLTLRKDFSSITGDIHHDRVRTIMLKHRPSGKLPLHFCTHAYTRGNKENKEVTKSAKLCDIARDEIQHQLESPLNPSNFNEGYKFGHEQEFLEFKKFDDSKNLVKTILDEMRHYVSAFANTFGGHLYIGINDHGEVCGQDCELIGDRFNFFNRVEGKIKEMIWIQHGRRLTKGDVHRGTHWDLQFIPVKLKKKETGITIPNEQQKPGPLMTEAASTGILQRQGSGTSALLSDEAVPGTSATSQSTLQNVCSGAGHIEDSQKRPTIQQQLMPSH
ncbi:uncharacterized protein [Amphiura filiformis]|uniref:uncharacterized protein n=1 Tax=Amphiura filiformis TaxID=82378 RepID=UPI003B2101E6